MNWHQTIIYIRNSPLFKELVEQAYLDENLKLNVERFGSSDEFQKTLAIIRTNHPGAKNILEVGAGNGFAAINFALQGYYVTVIEPDPSSTVGSGAIRQLVKEFDITDKVRVYETFGEDLKFKNETFDLVYMRQAMHHAHNLNKFILEAARVLKTGGYLFTARDHVIFNEHDMNWFLESHPLHKFYGGENAFKACEYRSAMVKAGLEIVNEFKYYDSVINYSPLSEQDKEDILELKRDELKNSLEEKFSFLSKIPFVFKLYELKNGVVKMQDYLNEREVPGRMYSYLARKI